MNTLEHSNIIREELKDLYSGQVIKNDDTEFPHMKRIKIRVRGVFEEPVKKNDIYWALPLMDCDIPALGDEVFVIFEFGDIERPRYFPKSVLSKEIAGVYESIYAEIIKKKKGSVVSGVSVVDGSISEPETESKGVFGKNVSVKIFPEDVAKEDGESVDIGSPSNGIMTEFVTEKGKESVSEYHPSGTFLEIHKDGTLVVHGVKDLYSITEGSKNIYGKGKFLMKIDDSLELKVGAGVKIVAEGDLSIISPNVEITGGTLTVNGVAKPTGSGAFCALPACLFTGAIHVGNKIEGT